MLLPLIRGTLKNIDESGCDASLSGPIARYDIDTIKKHVENIKDDEILKLYKVMGLATIKFFKNPGNAKMTELEEIFNE